MNMKHKYYVSFSFSSNAGSGFGGTIVNMDKKLEEQDDPQLVIDELNHGLQIVGGNDKTVVIAFTYLGYRQV